MYNRKQQRMETFKNKLEEIRTPLQDIASNLTVALNRLKDTVLADQHLNAMRSAAILMVSERKRVPTNVKTQIFGYFMGVYRFGNLKKLKIK